MSFALVVQSPEERALRSRLDEIEAALPNTPPGLAASLQRERASIEHKLGRSHVERLEAKRKLLVGKTDLASIRQRLSYERTQETLRAELDPANRPTHLARVEQLTDRITRLDVAAERQGRQQRVQASLANTPWVAARPANDPIVPNRCSTCADAEARLTAQDAGPKPFTAGRAREAIAARFPALVKPGPMTTHSLHVNHLEGACGKNAGGCAYLGSEAVFLPTNPTPALVNHEVLHSLTSARWGERVPRTVNEAMTEYLNRKMGYFPPGDWVMNKAYEGGQPLLDAYIRAKPAREQALVKAYFTGDFRDLEALEDPPALGTAPRTSPLDLRLSTWDSLLRNSLPGSSLTIDDESLRARAGTETPKPARAGL